MSNFMHGIMALLDHMQCHVIWPRHEQICLREFANNKIAESASLLFTYILLESIISRLAMSETSIFYLTSGAQQAGLNLTLSETPKTGFLISQLNKCSL